MWKPPACRDEVGTGGGESDNGRVPAGDSVLPTELGILASLQEEGLGLKPGLWVPVLLLDSLL